MFNLEEGLVVCSKSIKQFIIESVEKEGSFFNASYITLEDLKKRLFFDYKKRALYEVSKKYNVKVEIAKTYLNNLMYIDSIESTNDKILFLKELKDFLIKKDLLIVDKDFKVFLRGKIISLVGYEVTKELENIIDILSEIAVVKKVDVFNNKKDIKLFELSDINQEVNYVFNKISLLVDSGVSLNNIKLANVSKDYKFIVNRVSKSYGFVLKEASDGNLLNSDQLLFILKDVLNYDSFKEAFDNISGNNLLLNKIVDIVNSYEAYDINPKDFYDILEYELSNIKFEGIRYEESIEGIRFEESFYTDDYYIFHLGFNNDCIRTFKDEEYLDDKIKESLGINTSLEKNLEIRNSYIKRLSHYKNLYLTYTKNLTFTEALKSNLVDDINIKVIKVDDNIYLNEIETNLFLGQLLDNYYTFSEESSLLEEYFYNKFSYKNYNNIFKGIDKDTYEKFKQDVIKLSYSSLNEFEECSFKFFVNRVLKIDSFEDSLATKLGTFAHDILMDSYNKDFIFESSKENGMVNALTKKEVFFFNQVALIIKEVIEFNKGFETRSQLDKVMCEEKISLSFDDGKLVFEGLIDKVLYGEVDGKTLAAIIDYKTSVPNINLEKPNLQLLVYLYLITKSNLFDNLQVVGMYLQKIGPIKYKNSDKTPSEQLNEHLKLDGYSIKDTTYLSQFNSSYDEGYIKSMKIKKDGDFYSYSKVMTKDLINSYSSKIEELIFSVYDKIKESKFNINPKKDKKDDSCRYCKYSDICFKSFKDYNFIDDGTNKQLDEAGDIDVD